MNGILKGILADQKGGPIFTCFGAFHICVIIFFIALAVAGCLYLRGRPEIRTKTIDLCARVALGLYVLDFFLMPFAYGYIDIEKLPFHVCTAMCVMCNLSRRHPFFGRFKLQFAMLGFLSNLSYLAYPAGIMWHEIHPMSYRSVQTLLFHGVMMVYGVLVLAYEREGFSWKRWYKDFGVLAAMTLWAWVGNTLYNTQEDFHNWFFVVQDPFGLFPLSASPYIMPFFNIAIFFLAEVLVYFLLSGSGKRRAKAAT